MGTAGLPTQRNDERGERRYSLQDAYSAGLDAITKLAEEERLRAEAVAQLVGFTAIDGHITSGRFEVDGAGGAILSAALITDPDPINHSGLHPRQARVECFPATGRAAPGSALPVRGM